MIFYTLHSITYNLVYNIIEHIRDKQQSYTKNAAYWMHIHYVIIFSHKHILGIYDKICYFKI